MEIRRARRSGEGKVQVELGLGEDEQIADRLENGKDSCLSERHGAKTKHKGKEKRDCMLE